MEEIMKRIEQLEKENKEMHNNMKTCRYLAEKVMEFDVKLKDVAVLLKSLVKEREKSCRPTSLPPYDPFWE